MNYLSKSFLGLLTLSACFLSTSCGNTSKESVKSDTQQENVKENNEQKALDSLVADESFFQAALEGNKKELQEKIEKGVNVDALDPDGRTALMYASFNGQVEVMQLLLEKKSKVNVADVFGRTALMLAATCNNPDAVELLLKNKAEIDAYDSKDHFTALMYAAAEGKLENVKILVAHNANTELLTTENHNALFFANNSRHPKVVQYLKTKTSKMQ